MNLKKKYKWAIDIAKQHYKVLVNEFDYGYGLAIGVENENGETRGIVVQRPNFDENRKFIGLYELHDTPKTKQDLIDWLRICFDEPKILNAGDHIVFDCGDC